MPGTTRNPEPRHPLESFVDRDADRLTRASILTAIIGCAIIAAALLLAAAESGTDSLLRSDAQHFYGVALDPIADSTAGPSAYRYGRPLYPMISWLMALGRKGWILEALAVVYVGSYGAMLFLGTRLTHAPAKTLAVLLTPAVLLTAHYLVSEPFVIALLLGTYFLWSRGHGASARISASCLLLAREAAVLGLLPLVARDFARGSWRATRWWLLVPLPLVIWWSWIRVRLGVWPFLDPDPARSEALGPPFAGAVQVITSTTTTRIWLAVAIGFGIATIVIAVVSARVWFRGSLLADGAMCFGLLIPFFGVSVWSLPGEGVRLMMLPQVLVTMAAIERGWPRLASRSPLTPPSTDEVPVGQ